MLYAGGGGGGAATGDAAATYCTGYCACACCTHCCQKEGEGSAGEAVGNVCVTTRVSIEYEGVDRVEYGGVDGAVDRQMERRRRRGGHVSQMHFSEVSCMRCVMYEMHV